MNVPVPPPFPFNIQEFSHIQIFPPIGIARVGDSGFNLYTGSPDGEPEYFFPPEVPGHDQFPPHGLVDGAFKDKLYRVKRQAVVFHAYAFNAKNEVLGEVTASSGLTITWTVYVRNSKPSFTLFRGKHRPQTKDLRNPDVQSDKDPDQRDRLIVDPGPKSITITPSDRNPSHVPIAGDFYGSQDIPTEVHLGRIQADEKGRLVFIGGAGYSRCVSDPQKQNFQPDIISEFDSIGWIDDVCDGWVDVTIRVADTKFQCHAKHKATVMSAPPKFAWGIHAPTTLYDIIEDIYSGNKEPGEVQFYEHIWPMLSGTYELSWVNEKAFQGHGPAGLGNFLSMEHDLSRKDATYASLRKQIFGRLRKPEYKDPAQASTTYMPRLSGDDGDAIEPGQIIPSSGVPIKRFAALTALQYARFEKWAAGIFSADTSRWQEYETIEAVPVNMQPLSLTLAALEHSTGDPLYPGLETYWIAKDPDIYLIESQSPWTEGDSVPPFRINHEKVQPGHLSRGLSLPWQSDFSLCNTHWWPSGRPDDVINIMDWTTGAGKVESVSMNDFIDEISPRRKQWARGLRDTPDYPQDYYPGSTDMVRNWQKLGFVRQKKDYKIIDGSSTLPVWLEEERGYIQPNIGHMELTPGTDDEK
ncbi:hypothetical protein WOLCODRAFT_161779 [Wolfiporia cocos MD-104 SS10]|uniref:L-lysine 6-oxidase n=1 Tax=Wolfiporia cocos (strain MD-104) TaxID=742152 RepID=A0A2H3J944_WOLCO|nr:hypothetical protein WOLCODRAFT_161779 [Wolfiporia cocos MD-104 SS10]